MRQRKISKNTARDTHTRPVQRNIHQSQSTRSLKIMSGEIEIVQAEPFFRQTAVTVSLTKGGRVTGVAYPGAFVDPITNNIHGLYEGAVKGQMVTIGFLEGNSSAPMVINKYPYQGKGNSITSSKYMLPMTRKNFDASDIVLGHISGSYISLNSGITTGKVPGSISIISKTNIESECLISKLSANISVEIKTKATTIESDNIKLKGTIELNGNTDYAVKFNKLKTAFDQLKTDLNNLITSYNGHTNGTYGFTGVPAVASTADMSDAKDDKVLL